MDPDAPSVRSALEVIMAELPKISDRERLVEVLSGAQRYLGEGADPAPAQEIAEFNRAHYTPFLRFLMTHMGPQWFDLLAYDRLDLWDVFFLEGPADQAFLVLMDSLVRTGPCIRLDRCIHVLERFLQRGTLATVIWEVCQQQLEATPTPVLHEAVLTRICSLPDHLANCLQKQNKAAFYPENYYPCVGNAILCVLQMVSVSLRDGKGCSISFVSHVLGKVCMQGRQQELLSLLVPRLTALVQSDCIWQRMCWRLIESVPDRWMEPVVSGLVQAADGSTSLSQLLGDLVLKNKKTQFLLTQKLLFLKFSLKKETLQSILGYLSMESSRRWLLIRVLKQLLEVWSSGGVVRHSPYPQLLHLSRCIFICLDLLTKEEAIGCRQELLLALTAGTRLYLDSSVPPVRCLGMVVAECLSRHLEPEGPTLSFQYEENEEIKDLKSLLTRPCSCAEHPEEPVKEAVMEPVMNPVMEPVKEAVIEPVKEAVIEPVKEAVIEPVKEAVIEPVKKPMKEAVMEPVKKPVREAVKKPVMEPVKEAVMDPVKKPVREPVMKPVMEPVKDPVKEAVMKPVMEPVREAVKDPVKVKSESSRPTPRRPSRKNDYKLRRAAKLAAKAEAEADSELDSDDDLSPYDMSADIALRQGRIPAYIRDCMEELLSGDLERLEVSLTVIFSVLRSNPSAAKEVSIELVKILLHLDDRPSVKNFNQLRYAAMVSVAIIDPVPVCQYLVCEFYSLNYSLRQRMDILDVLVTAAKELSETPETAAANSRPSSSSKGKAKDVASINWKEVIEERIENKTRRFAKGKKKTTPVPTPNRFHAVVGHLFFPLIQHFDKPVVTFDLLGEDRLILGRLAPSLGIMMHLSLNATIAPQMGKSLLDFVWALRLHTDAFVRQGLLFCVSTVLLSVPWERLMSDLIEELLQMKTWLGDVVETDSDEDCCRQAMSCMMLMEKFHNELQPSPNV